MAFTQSGMSAEALVAMAELDIPPSKNPAVMAVINDMLRPDSLPPGWQVRYDPVQERREYYNEQGDVQYKHPLASYYRGAAFMEMGGFRQLQSNETDQPPAPQEVLDMCAYLGVNTRDDDPYVVEVARLAISAPLPPNWEEGEDDEGNPLFSNHETGQSQPSHPLDPYFLELIKRRKRELAIRNDGVGIRSALAAKRLYEIGVPGITLPPELQEAEGRKAAGTAGANGMRMEDADDEDEDEEDPSAAARNFGPLLTIEEADDEGRDEDEHLRKTAKQSQLPPAPPQQQQQPQAQQQRQQQHHLMLEDFDDFEEDEPPPPAAVAAPPPPPPPPPPPAPKAQEEEEEEEEVDAAEAERRRKMQRELDDWNRRQEEEEKAEKEEEERQRKMEEERQQRLREEKERKEEEERKARLQAERERREQEQEREREAEAEAERQRLREQERNQNPDAERRRLKEQEEKEKAAAKAAAERQALLDALREADGDLAGEEEEEEEEEEETVLPTLAQGISGLAIVRQAESMDSGISSTACLVQPPPLSPVPALAAAVKAAASGDSRDDEYDNDGDSKGVDDKDDDKDDGKEGEEEDEGEKVRLAPFPPPPAALTAEQLVLGEEEAPPPPPPPPPVVPDRRRGHRRADDDDYDDDFESYCSDFDSYASSRQPTRDGRRTAGATQQDASRRPATTSQQLVAAVAAALTAPTTPEKLPSGTSTPTPPLVVASGEQEDDYEYDADDAAGSSNLRLPSPPTAPPPGSMSPRRHSTGGSRSRSRGSQKAAVTRGSSRARSAVASSAGEEDDERAVPGGEDGDDEGGGHEADDGDEGNALAHIRQQAAEAARSAAAAAAEFDAKFPPLPVPLDEGGVELRRSRSYTDIETGRLMKQISAIEAARSRVPSSMGARPAVNLDDAAAAAADGSLYAVARLPSGRLELLRSRVYGSSSAASAAAAAAAAVAAASPPSRNNVRTPSRERIRVAVRVRPVPKVGELEAWHIDPASRTVRLKEGAVNSTHRHISADRVYSFDLVLGPTSTTKQLWASHVVPLMDASLSGVNTTVFAYGQTGSGKTHTMFGSDGRYEDGTIAMSLTYLFKALQTLHKIKVGAEEYMVKISMLELYNEQLRDLLAPGGGPFDRLGRPSGAPLALQDDPRVGVRVSGLEEHAVADVPAAMALVARGAFSRSIGSTAMNEVSSRSHTIVRLALETREVSTRELLHTSLVSFVDLAGSERLAKTGSTGARFVEGTNINISLLMLGTVVSKLAEGRAGEFIPYRNSKLTRLLQPCLGGNSKTAIIATINPSIDQIEETFNTLGFATRAMDVVNQVSVNSYIRSSGAVGGALTGAAAAALQKQVATLKAELAALKKEAGSGYGGGLGSGTALLSAHEGGGNVALMAERLARLEIEKARLLDRLETLTGRPQGDVYDDLPPTPPDLNLPPARPPGRSGSSSSLITTTTPLLALRSIARLVCVGRVAGGGSSKSLIPRPNEQIPPDEVVAAVRKMRDERDELRRRDTKLRQNLNEVSERLAEVEPYKVLSEQVKEVVGMLENILGPSPLPEADDSDPATAAANQAARLAENVQAVAMMHNELSALQRQLATSEMMAAAAARRSENAEVALQRVAAAAAADWVATAEEGADARLKNLVEQLNSQLTAVRREFDVTKSELAKWRGLAVAPEMAGPAAAGGGGGGGGDAYDDDDGNDAANRLLGPANLNVGSFALRRAREALVQASVMEARRNAAEAERDELRDRLQALEEAVATGAPIVRGVISPAAAQDQRQRQQQRPASASGPGQAEDGGDPLNASMGGPGGQQRFEQIKSHVSSLGQEVSALTRERDTLLAMVLRMQAPQPNGAPGGNMNPLPGGRPMGQNGTNLVYGGIDAGAAAGYSFGTNNVFSSVPVQSGIEMGPMGMAGGGAAGPRGRGGPLAGTALDPHGDWEMDPMMAAALMRDGGSPVKLKPVRGRVPHQHHHYRHLRDGAVSDGYGNPGGGGGHGNNDFQKRPEFNVRDMPLEAKHRVNRLRDRASRLNASVSNTPPALADYGLGLVGKGVGSMQEQDPVLYGHRDAEVYALKRKLVLAEKARSEAAARSQAELRSLQQYDDLLNYRGGGVGAGMGGGAAAPMGFSTQMALASANRDFKDQARSHAVEMRQMEVVHEENLAATRAEAAAVFKQLVEENNRLKMILVTGAPPGGGGGGGGGAGNTAAASIDFPLRSLGGFGAPGNGGGTGMGMSYSESPPRRGPSHLSPHRGSNISPLRNQSSLMLPPMIPPGVAGGAGAMRSDRGRVSSQQR